MDNNEMNEDVKSIIAKHKLHVDITEQFEDTLEVYITDPKNKSRRRKVRNLYLTRREWFSYVILKYRMNNITRN